MKNLHKDNKDNKKESLVYNSTYTTCKCGKPVELKKENMRWLQSSCSCGTEIRLMDGKMIVN